MSHGNQTQQVFEGFKRPAYTQIPNIIFDRYLPSLNEGELKVLLYIARKTLGWHKESDSMSIARICTGYQSTAGVGPLDCGTGLSRSAAIRSLRSLRTRGFILRSTIWSPDNGRQMCNVYRLRFIEEPVDIGPDEDDDVEESPFVNVSRSGLVWVGEGVAGDTPPHVTTDTPGVSLETPLQNKVVQKKESSSSPIVPAETLDSDATTKTIKCKLQGIRGRKVKVGTPERRAIVEVVNRAAAADFQEQEVLDIVDHWIAKYIDGPEREQPVKLLVGYLDSAIRGGPSTKTPPSAAPGGIGEAAGPSPVPTDPPIAPATPNGPESPSPSIPELALRWNRLVPDGPQVDLWDPAPDKDAQTQRDITDRLGDPKFVVNFERLCEKANRIHVANKECTWLDFRWVVKNGNWWKVITGKYDFKATNGKPAQESVSSGTAAALAVIRNYEAKKAKEKEKQDHATH